MLRDGDRGSSGGADLFEVGRIVRVLNWRFPRHFCISDIQPVEISEPGMLFYVFSVVLGSQPALRVGVEQI